MNKSSPFSALASLKTNFRHRTREHEICRLQFEFRDDKAATQAKQIILEWAERRSGKFPAEAWKLDTFEAISVAGRSTMASVIERDDVTIWGLRNEDPDKEVAGRIWSTEVVIGGLNSGKPKMSVRLLAHSSEEFLPIKTSVPGFVFQIFRDIGFAGDAAPLSMEPRWIGDEEEFETFCKFLENENRRLPIIVVTNEARSHGPLIHTHDLAKGTLGLAHTIQLNGHFAWELSERIGSDLSVFDGGIRLYMPGFSVNDDFQDHKLLVGRNLQEGHEKGKADGWFRRLSAEYSLERLKLGTDVLSYARVRSESRKLRAMTVLESSSSSDEQLAALQAQNDALEKERAEIFELSELYDFERLEAVERASDAEQKLQAAAFRIAQLESALTSKGVSDVIKVPNPTNWHEIADWCARKFVGKLTLLPSAIRGLKKPEFENVDTVIDALEWLGTECRDARLDGGGNRMNNTKILNGLTHALCGGDEFQTMHKGTRRDVDWHIKNGDGNTRDPKRCLRIYYFWDEQSQEIVVADLPAHRKNENS